jgi:hypothetical protein
MEARESYAVAHEQGSNMRGITEREKNWDSLPKSAYKPLASY